MGITIEWFEKDHEILIVNVEGHWDWSEMFQVIDSANAMIDTVDHPVCTLFDVTHACGLPPNPLSHIQRASRMRHPRASRGAIVGVSGFLLHISELAQRFGGLNNASGVYFFQNREQALQHLLSYIAERDTII